MGDGSIVMKVVLIPLISYKIKFLFFFIFSGYPHYSKLLLCFILIIFSYSLHCIIYIICYSHALNIFNNNIVCIIYIVLIPVKKLLNFLCFYSIQSTV